MKHFDPTAQVRYLRNAFHRENLNGGMMSTYFSEDFRFQKELTQVITRFCNANMYDECAEVLNLLSMALACDSFWYFWGRYEYQKLPVSKGNDSSKWMLTLHLHPGFCNRELRFDTAMCPCLIVLDEHKLGINVSKLFIAMAKCRTMKFSGNTTTGDWRHYHLGF